MIDKGKIKNSQREIALGRKLKSYRMATKFQPSLTDEKRENILKLYRAEKDFKLREGFASYFYFHRDKKGLQAIIAIEKHPMVIAFAKSYKQDLQ